MIERQAFYETASDKTVPEWEAKCHSIRQMAVERPSTVSVSLQSLKLPDRVFVSAHAQMTTKQARDYAKRLVAAADDAEAFDAKKENKDE